jgi:hypothetical protein
MMNLARRSFRRSLNMEMMKMAVWCPRLSTYYYFDYGDGRPLSHTYDDKPRSRRSYFGGG